MFLRYYFWSISIPPNQPESTRQFNEISFYFFPPTRPCLLRISYDVMSFNPFSLADWFTVIDKVDALWSHALALRTSKPQSSVGGCHVDPATESAPTPAGRLFVVYRAAHRWGDWSSAALPFTSPTGEAGVSPGGSFYFLIELKGKLWRLEQRASPPTWLITIEVVNSDNRSLIL